MKQIKYGSRIKSGMTWSTITVTIILFTAGCGQAINSEFVPLVERQPYVMSVSPTTGTVLEDNTSIVLEFSQPLDATTINGSSIALIQGSVDGQDAQAITKQLTQNALTNIPLKYAQDESQRQVTLTLDTGLSKGIFTLVVTPNLLSAEGIPFNQSPGDNTQLFQASYGYGLNQEETTQLVEAVENNQPAGNYYGPAPEILVINEILYDVVGSDTNGQVFVELWGTAGSDISDYKILLINGEDGEKTAELAIPYGTVLDDTGIFVIADLKTGSQTETQVLNWNMLANFDPQNGPDTAQLLGRDGQLVDVVGYGELKLTAAFNGHLTFEGAPTKLVAAGHSLSRANGIDTDNNFADFVDVEMPTPGGL